MPTMADTMGEYKAGKLRSGSATGPLVKSRSQAIAIGLSQARRADEDVTPPKPEKPTNKTSQGSAPKPVSGRIQAAALRAS